MTISRWGGCLDNKIDKRAELSSKLVEQYQSANQSYKDDQESWYNFAFGDQWTEDVRKVLKERQQAPLTFPYIAAAVEQAVAYLTAKSPSFAATGRDDADTKIGKVASNWLSYLWYVNDGDLEFPRVVFDHQTRGQGYLYISPDPDADQGKGELTLKYYDPRFVLVDPNSKHPLYDDAAHILLVDEITDENYKNAYPDKIGLLKTALQSDESIAPSSKETNELGSIQVRDDVSDYATRDSNKYRITTRLSKISVPFIRFMNTTTREEGVMSKEEWDKTLSEPRWIFILMDSTQYIETQEEAMMLQFKLDQEEVPYRITQVTKEYFVKNKIIETNAYHEKRIKMIMDVGGNVMYDKTLPISNYNLIHFPNKHTGTPYPLSDVSLVITVQEFINKMMSLVVAHTQATTTLKLLIPKDSVESIEDVAEAWLKPNAVIEYDPSSGGKPEVPQMAPLTSALINLIMMAKHMIEYQFGIFETMMGNGENAPTTAQGTVMIDSNGQQRIRFKLRGLEQSLRRAGQVLLEWSSDFYKSEKPFKVLSHDGTVQKQGVINAPIYDEMGEFVNQIFDLSKQRYDCVVVAGSTLPSNKWMEYQVYEKAYQMGLIDQEEALKKSEIFDKEGVLERMGKIKQLTQAVEQYTQQVKKLEGDLQTAQRETVHSRQQVEVEKFTADLEILLAKLKAGGELDAKRLEMEITSIIGELGNALPK